MIECGRGNVDLPQDKNTKPFNLDYLNEDINMFFGKNLQLPVTNKSNHEHYTNYYNKCSADIIYNRYKEDFKKYNYKKI